MISVVGIVVTTAITAATAAIVAATTMEADWRMGLAGAWTGKAVTTIERIRY